MSKVFISYRREDGGCRQFLGSLSAIYDATRFSWDVDTVEPGVDFVTRIEQAVNESDVLKTPR